MPYRIAQFHPYHTARRNLQCNLPSTVIAVPGPPYLVAIQQPQTTVSTPSARPRVKRLFFQSSFTLPSIFLILLFPLATHCHFFPPFTSFRQTLGPLNILWLGRRQIGKLLYRSPVTSLLRAQGQFLFPSSYQDGPPILDPIRRFGLIFPLFFVHDSTLENKNKIEDSQARPSH